MKRSFQERGFSVIELAIVIAIIGVLTGISVPNFLKMARVAKVNSTIATLNIFKKSIMAMRASEGMFLKDITGHTCSRCMFARPGDLADSMVPTPEAEANYKTLGFVSIDASLDSWGQFILLDENEMEFGADCEQDILVSVGADGMFDGGITRPANDDIWVKIPLYAQQPGCSQVTRAQVGPNAYEL